MSADEGLPRVVARRVGDELDDVIAAARLAVVRHPVAAQAMFAALVAEGRRVAATPEGQARRERLARSRLLRRVREAWEASTWNLPQDDPDAVLPTTWLEVVLMAAATGGIEGRLSSGDGDGR